MDFDGVEDCNLCGFFLEADFPDETRGWSPLPESDLSTSDKYISQFGQIHFKIWTNTFHNLDKYICQFKQELFLRQTFNEISSLNAPITQQETKWKEKQECSISRSLSPLGRTSRK